MIQLNREGTVVSESEEELEKQRGEFLRQHCVRLPQLIEPGLRQFLLRKIEKAQFNPEVFENIGIDYRMEDNIASQLLHLLTNDQGFLRIIEQITGKGPIRGFGGRVHRLAPAGLTWHDDLTEPDSPRLLAMSINLSDEPESRILLQMRDSRSEEIVFQAENSVIGDAVVFRLDRSLEHQVTPVGSTLRKTAFSGFFTNKSGYSLPAGPPA